MSKKTKLATTQELTDICGQKVVPGDTCCFSWCDGELKIGVFEKVTEHTNYGRIAYTIHFKTVALKSEYNRTAQQWDYRLEDTVARHKIVGDTKDPKVLKVDPSHMAPHICVTRGNYC